jgi:putative ABC transport system permease protein
MLTTLKVLWFGFKMAINELRVNKLRTALSLMGISFGIFCIISVLAVVNSLEKNISNELKDLGNNSIFIDKWQYSGGPDYPWWKFMKRPDMKYEEMRFIKEKTPAARNVAFTASTSGNASWEDIVLDGINYYGVSEEFNQVQSIEIEHGRYINTAEFEQGTPNILLGAEIAEKLFGEAALGISKQIQLKNNKANIIGILKKKGKGMVGGWDFDQSIILSYRHLRTMVDEKSSGPSILVRANDGEKTDKLKDELKAAMRSIRKLSPTEEDNFTLNDINSATDEIRGIFTNINIGGWAISILSLIVGMFGVANIMFVTVKERTPQIGLKKAIGAKNKTIMSEFLMESAFLCVIGGMIGLIFCFIMALGVTKFLDFKVTIPFNFIMLATLICSVVGLLAGIIPAYKASKLDAVVAIRS